MGDMVAAKYIPKENFQQKQDQTKKESLVSDRIDLLMQAIKIHTQYQEITPDLVLFKSDENDRKFIRTNFKLAEQAKTLLKNEETARKIYNMLIMDCIMLAVLKRNENDNPMLFGLFSNQEEDEDKSIIERIKEKIRGKTEK